MNHAIAYCCVALLCWAWGYWVGGSDAVRLHVERPKAVTQKPSSDRIVPCFDDVMQKRKLD